MCSDMNIFDKLDDREGLNPTLDWICALTSRTHYLTVFTVQVLILLWTGYVL